jgi:AcrR family transcriptional regulator
MGRKAQPDQPTEHAIVAAAEQLFLERGYALTSTVEIAKRVGCNQALVHYYFRTKENLLQAIFARKARVFVEALASLDEQDLPFEQAIVRLIETHFDVLAAEPRLPFLIVSEVTTNPERLKAVEAMVRTSLPAKAIKRLEKKLEQAIAGGRVRKTTLFDVLLTAAGLNVTLFMMQPVVGRALNASNDKLAGFLSHRRREHVEVVLRSLKP